MGCALCGSACVGKYCRSCGTGVERGQLATDEAMPQNNDWWRCKECGHEYRARFGDACEECGAPDPERLETAGDQ